MGVSCQVNDPDFSQPPLSENDPSLKPLREIIIDVLLEENHIESPYIRLMARMEKWVMFEIRHNKLEQDSTRSFVFMNEEESIGYYLYAMSDMVVMAEFTDDPLENFLGGNVFVTIYDNKYTRFSVVKDFFNEQEILYETIVENVEKSYKMPSKSSDDFDEDIYRIVTKHFKSLSEEINNMSSTTTLILGDALGMVADIWEKCVIPAAHRMLTSGNSALEDDLYEEIQTDSDELLGITVYMNPERSFIDKIADYGREKIAIIKNWFNHDVEGEGNNTIDDVTYKILLNRAKEVNKLYNQMRSYMQDNPECTVMLSITNVEENSAKAVIALSPFIENDFLHTEIKLKYKNMTTGVTNEKVFFNTLSCEHTLDNLTKCTGYNCWVEVKIGRTYRSNTEKFLTLGKPRIDPNAIVFQSTGGWETARLLIYPEFLIGFELDNIPNWITKVEKGSTSFWLEAGPNETGTRIVDNLRIVAHFIDGRTEVTFIPVIHETTVGWDGTKWKFYHTSLGGDFTIEIIDVANSKVVCSVFESFDYGNTTSMVSQQSDGTLLLKQSYSYGDADFNITMKLEISLLRINATEVFARIKMQVHASDNSNNQNGSELIECTGTLITE